MKSKKIIVIAALITAISLPTSVYGYNSYNFNKQMEFGQVALENENFEDANKYFKEALKYNEKRSKEINEKISSVESLKKSKELYQAGSILLEEKKFIEAIDTFKKISQGTDKYYAEAQEKISDSKNLFVNHNIDLAKSKAEGKSYTDAIVYLDTILKFDEKNQEASNLKNEYNNEINRIREEEEAAKRKAEQDAANKKAEQEAAKKKAEQEAAKKVQSATASKSSSKVTNNNTAPVQKNTEPIVKADGQGWFSVYKNDGDSFPIDMFGFKSPMSIQFGGDVYFQFVGNDINYEITFHLSSGIVKRSYKSSREVHFLDGIVKGESIRIDISAVYKGKTYTDSFTRVIL